MNIEDAIVTINLPLKGKIMKHLTNEALFKELIKFIDYRAVEKLKVRSDHETSVINTNIRNVDGYSLCPRKISDKIYFKHIDQIIAYCYAFYKAKFPLIQTSNLNQIDLLKYEPTGKFEQHVDHYFGSYRTLTFILNLNEKYEGGDFIFYDQKDKEIKRVPCKTGTVIFFPSNFLYPHCVKPIKKGTRYSIAGWLV